MSNNKLGVEELPNGKWAAKLGQRILGEFDTLKEAATKYNEHISKVFVFPIYNKEGKIPSNEEDK